MFERYPNLLRPLAARNVLFRNRLFTAPSGLHSLQCGESGPSEGIITHFANKARGGAAAVTCNGVNIFPFLQKDSGKVGWNIYDEGVRHALRWLADRVAFYGAVPSMEFRGGGVFGPEECVSDGTLLFDGRPGRQVSDTRMEQVAQAYADATEILRDCGFQMVMIHFGHGGQIAQFLSPLTNHRTDEYGGSFENRCRYPAEILARIRQRVGGSMLIELRLSGTEFEPGGIPIEECCAFVKQVEGQIDFAHISAGMHIDRWLTRTHPTGFYPPTPNVFLAEAVKRSGVSVPVVTIGGIQDLDEADAILGAGRADVVSIARGFIADPELGRKAYEGRGEDVVPCIKCLRCHDSSVYEHRYVCSVNPLIGLEHLADRMVAPAAAPKKVAVIGGGPAGMQAALTAAARGHRVTLFERSGELGGALKFARFVGFKYSLEKYRAYLARKLGESGVELRLGTEASPALVAALGFDEVIPALGAEPVRPPIPGADGANVRTAPDCYGREDTLGERIAIVGGGQVGCETALHLAMLGKQVTLVELRETLAPDASRSQRLDIELNVPKYTNLTVLTGTAVTAIDGAGLRCCTTAGEARSIAADTVLLAAGMRARQTEALAYFGAAPRCEPVGDCRQVGTVEGAVRSGFAAAVNL